MKLKRCPICGEHAEISEHYMFGKHSEPSYDCVCVGTKPCFHPHTGMFSTKNQASESWNRRFIEDKLNRKIKQLRSDIILTATEHDKTIDELNSIRRSR